MMTIRVRSGRQDNRVALWEQHPDHPGGEVFVAGSRVVEVAQTARVLALLRVGVLVRAEAAAVPAMPAAEQNARRSKRK